MEAPSATGRGPVSDSKPSKGVPLLMIAWGTEEDPSTSIKTSGRSPDASTSEAPTPWSTKTSFARESSRMYFNSRDARLMFRLTTTACSAAAAKWMRITAAEFRQWTAIASPRPMPCLSSQKARAADSR